MKETASSGTTGSPPVQSVAAVTEDTSKSPNPFQKLTEDCRKLGTEMQPILMTRIYEHLQSIDVDALYKALNIARPQCAGGISVLSLAKLTPDVMHALIPNPLAMQLLFPSVFRAIPGYASVEEAAKHPDDWTCGSKIGASKGSEYASREQMFAFHAFMSKIHANVSDELWKRSTHSTDAGTRLCVNVAIQLIRMRSELELMKRYFFTYAIFLTSLGIEFADQSVGLLRRTDRTSALFAKLECDYAKTPDELKGIMTNFSVVIFSLRSFGFYAHARHLFDFLTAELFQNKLLFEHYKQKTENNILPWQWCYCATMLPTLDSSIGQTATTTAAQSLSSTVPINVKPSNVYVTNVLSKKRRTTILSELLKERMSTLPDKCKLDDDGIPMAISSKTKLLVPITQIQNSVITASYALVNFKIGGGGNGSGTGDHYHMFGYSALTYWQ